MSVSASSNVGAGVSRGVGVSKSRKRLTRYDLVFRDGKFWCAVPGCGKGYKSEESAFQHMINGKKHGPANTKKIASLNRTFCPYCAFVPNKKTAAEKKRAVDRHARVSHPDKM